VSSSQSQKSPLSTSSEQSTQEGTPIRKKREDKAQLKLEDKIEKSVRKSQQPAKQVSQIEQMNQNAEMVIASHRALFSKPGELAKTVKIGIKRNRT
jgi:hypothetical protein